MSVKHLHLDRKAIEAEARHATLERVREGVERLPLRTMPRWVDRAAVLALLDELDHA